MSDFRDKPWSKVLTKIKCLLNCKKYLRTLRQVLKSSATYTEYRSMQLSVGAKLNILLLLLMLTGIGGATYTSTRLFTTDLIGYFKKGTLDTSSLIAGRVNSELGKYISRAQILGTAALYEFRYPEDRLKFIEKQFSSQSQFIAIGSYSLNPVQAKWRVVNPDLVYRYSLNPQELAAIEIANPVDLKRIGKGQVHIQSFQTPKGLKAIRIAFPLVKESNGQFSTFMIVDLDQESMSQVLAETSNFMSFLMDNTGKVLGSTNATALPFGKTLKHLEFDASLGVMQKEFVDPEGVKQIGAIAPVGFGDLRVVTQIPEEQAQLAQNKLLKRMAFLAATFAFFALLLGVLFADNLLARIRALAEAAEKVRLGQFGTRITTLVKGQLKVQDELHGDEIQKFAGIFNHMVEGIQEREKMKGILEKFHHKDIVNALLKKNKLDLSGEKLMGTILFVDIRGFSGISERMQPEKVLTLLNEYLGMLVGIISKRNGVVDKYIGDAIMVMWGVPKSLGQDVESALYTCLEIRQSLAVLNQKLAREGRPELKIGMGLHIGPVFAGTVGTHEKMQYTVIGDTVNTASRLEAATKKYGVDLLISQSVFDASKGKFITTPMDNIRLRGKTERVNIYKVEGFIDEKGNPTIVQTPFSSFEPDSDFSETTFVA